MEIGILAGAHQYFLLVYFSLVKLIFLHLFFFTAVIGFQLNQVPIIFVVGNSRSGTTMMGRVLSGHSSVHTFSELHFFDSIASADSIFSENTLSQIVCENVVAKLLNRQNNGLWAAFREDEWSELAKQIVKDSNVSSLLGAYTGFLKHVVSQEGKTVACKQSPYYLSYINEINELLDNVYFINLIRDPRAVAFSQKNRWKRGKFSDGQHPFFRETVRSWCNYHPEITSLIWKGCVRKAEKCNAFDNFISVKYEDLVSSPEKTVLQICTLVGLEFQPSMLDVPQVGSSLKADDQHSTGFDASRLATWRKPDGLTEEEIHLIQSRTSVEMEQYGYDKDETNIRLLRLIALQAMGLLKASASFVLTIVFSKNVVALIRRRLNL